MHKVSRLARYLHSKAHSEIVPFLPIFRQSRRAARLRASALTCSQKLHNMISAATIEHSIHKRHTNHLQALCDFTARIVTAMKRRRTWQSERYPILW